MQTATSETESKFRDLSICVHHYNLRVPCPEGQGIQPFSLARSLAGFNRLLRLARFQVNPFAIKRMYPTLQ